MYISGIGYWTHVSLVDSEEVEGILRGLDFLERFNIIRNIKLTARKTSIANSVLHVEFTNNHSSSYIIF